MKDYNKEWRLRNPEKVRAHWQVGNAIRSGVLKRQPCECCGNEKSHAHHEDYSKPLEIKWLCHRCHWNEHGWIKEEKENVKSRPWNTKIDQNLDKAKELRAMGFTYAKIAFELKATKGTIYKWLNDVDYK